MELKPCPFCGGKAVRTEINDCTGRNKWAIMCSNPKCCVTPITDAYATKGADAKAWNRRADDAEV